jgi:hypothetical protein
MPIIRADHKRSQSEMQSGDVTPFIGPVLLRAVGVIRPHSIAGELSGSYPPGDPAED